MPTQLTRPLRRAAFPDPLDAANYAALIERITALMGCTEDSPEEDELARLAAEAEVLEKTVGWTP